MDSHLIVWVVGIGSVAALILWLCLIAGAEGERLSADLDRELLARRPAQGATAPAPRLRAVADPEYGLMLVAEGERPSWYPSSATA